MSSLDREGTVEGEEFGNIARAVSRKAEREDKVYP